MSLDDLYKEVILDHYKNPRNKRELPEAELSCSRNNPLCGDEITVFAHVEDGTVAGVAFQGQGCSISQSSASMLTEAVKGKPVGEALHLAADFRGMMAGEVDPSEDEFGDMAYRRIDLRRPSLDWLLVLVPVAAISDYGLHNELLTFLTSALAILPLAGLIGRATEQLAAHAGPKTGGLLNATFGNVAELIISIFLILKGELDVVKASLIGSIIGNLLLVLGLSLFVRGLRHPQPRYSADAASVPSTSLILAVTGLLMPALFVLSTGSNEFAERETVSVVVAFGELVRPGAQHEQGRHEQAGDRQDEGCG